MSIISGDTAIGLAVEEGHIKVVEFLAQEASDKYGKIQTFHLDQPLKG